LKKAEMSKALLRAADSEVLRTHEGTSFDLESYTYKLENTPQGPQFSVSQGSESTKMPMTWAFGDGTVGQVYVTDVNGTFYESHFSYYGGTKGFDRTTNQPNRAKSLPSAVGRGMMPDEARKCFVCHSAAVTAEGPLDNVMPGVTCEACHGPAPIMSPP
jgi:Cytochrome c554 and c-prime